jgi:hypothetical protein
MVVVYQTLVYVYKNLVVLVQVDITRTYLTIELIE